jgi:murein L,D-transpeptidase YcbB/YkuD
MMRQTFPASQDASFSGVPIALFAAVKTLLFLTLTSILWPSAVFGQLSLAVDLSNRELTAMVNGDIVDTFPVAIGSDDYPTPQGSFHIRKVIWNPTWVPPDSKWARGKEPKAAGDPDNPMKRVKMFFKEPDYFIHGTADEDSLGAAESHGCLRMRVSDVTRLAKLVMEAGGKPMPEPWYRRIFRRKTTKVVYLTAPVPIDIRS